MPNAPRTVTQPAFPMIRDMRHNADWDHEEGMSLRDYFAAKAMNMKFGPEHGTVSLTEMATFCYLMADAMMKAREA